LANGQYLVVICHGFRGAKENGGNVFAFAEKLQGLGLGVLAFDFSGSGCSEGDFLHSTLSRQADDLRQVIDYVSAKFSLPIILLGRSFGGSTVLVGGAGDARIAGYIFWSTPVFMQQTFATILTEDYLRLQQGNTVRIMDEAGEYWLHPDLILDFNQHDMDSYLHKIKSIPTLIVHAADDEVVPPSNALHMQDKLENSSIFVLDHAGHRFQENIAVRETITVDWLKNTFRL
jgi:pimeloyl-ACP methyl ester carboxylesterase